MPLILFDRVCLTDQFSSVIADGVQSAQMATQHLLDNGSRRVAFIGGANHLDIVKRRKHGYLEALRDNRIPIEKELVVCRKIDYEEVSHQTYKMGETACQLLIDQIKGDRTIKQVIIPTHLQIRESSIKENNIKGAVST